MIVFIGYTSPWLQSISFFFDFYFFLILGHQKAGESRIDFKIKKTLAGFLKIKEKELINAIVLKPEGKMKIVLIF